MMTLDRIFYKLYNYYGPQKWWPADSDIEMMIGAVLVQNTNWLNVERALQNFPNFDGALISTLSHDTICERIRPAGFYVRKAQTILNLMKWYKNYQFSTLVVNEIETPQLRQELLSIKGIGEETCDCILLYTFNRPVFVVDAYLKRLLGKMGYPPMKQYQKIQRMMMEQLPHDVIIYQEFHALIVAYGKEFLKEGLIHNDPLMDKKAYVEYPLQALLDLQRNEVFMELLEQYGYLERPRFEDPFWGIVYAIIGQLISTKAANTIMTRFAERYPTLKKVQEASVEDLKAVGLTKQKASYIKNVAMMIAEGSLNLDEVYAMTDNEAVYYLSKIKGIGIWSAKIILMHSYNRLNLESYDDIALRNAVIRLQKVESLSKSAFEEYFEQFTPYKTIMCIYLWRYNAQK